MNNQTTVVCPQCGNVEAAGNAYCSKCGAPIPVQQPTPPVYDQQMQYNQYNQYQPQPTSINMKTLSFFGGLGGAGLYAFCHLIADLARVGGAYGWPHVFDLFGALGLAVSVAAAFFYIKEKFNEK